MSFVEGFGLGNKIVGDHLDRKQRDEELAARNADSLRRDAREQETLGIARGNSELQRTEAENLKSYRDKTLAQQETDSKRQYESRAEDRKSAERVSREIGDRQIRVLREEQELNRRQLQDVSMTAAWYQTGNPALLPYVQRATGLDMKTLIDPRTVAGFQEVQTALGSGQIPSQAALSAVAAPMFSSEIGKEAGGGKVVSVNPRDTRFIGGGKGGGGRQRPSIAITADYVVQTPDGRSVTQTKTVTRPLDYWMERMRGTEMIARAIHQNPDAMKVVGGMLGLGAAKPADPKTLSRDYQDMLSAMESSATDLIKDLSSDNPDAVEQTKSAIIYSATGGETHLFDANNPDHQRLLARYVGDAAFRRQLAEENYPFADFAARNGGPGYEAAPAVAAAEPAASPAPQPAGQDTRAKLISFQRAASEAAGREVTPAEVTTIIKKARENGLTPHSWGSEDFLKYWAVNNPSDPTGY